MKFRQANKDWKQWAEAELEQRALDAIPKNRFYSIGSSKSCFLGLSNDWEDRFNNFETLFDQLLYSIGNFVDQDTDWQMFQQEIFRAKQEEFRTRLNDHNHIEYSWVQGGGSYQHYLSFVFQREIKISDALQRAQNAFSHWNGEVYERANTVGYVQTSELKKLLFGLIVSSSGLHFAQYGSIRRPYSHDYSGLLIATSKGKHVQFLHHRILKKSRLRVPRF